MREWGGGGGCGLDVAAFTEVVMMMMMMKQQDVKLSLVYIEDDRPLVLKTSS